MNADLRLEIIYLCYRDKIDLFWVMDYASQHYQNGKKKRKTLLNSTQLVYKQIVSDYSGSENILYMVKTLAVV